MPWSHNNFAKYSIAHASIEEQCLGTALAFIVTRARTPGTQSGTLWREFSNGLGRSGAHRVVRARPGFLVRLAVPPENDSRRVA